MGAVLFTSTGWQHGSLNSKLSLLALTPPPSWQQTCQLPELISLANCRVILIRHIAITTAKPNKKDLEP